MAVYIDPVTGKEIPLDADLVCELLQDGNISELDMSDDELEEIIIQSQDNSMIEATDVSLLSNSEQQPTTSTSSTFHALPSPGLPASIPTKLKEAPRRRIWKKTAYCDQVHDFPGHPAPALIRTPLEYFEDYYSDEFFSNMALQTNLYYMKTTGRLLNTNKVEVKKLYGIHLLMGIFKYPRIALYWRSNFQLEMVVKSMTRDRFTTLRNALHVVDNDSPRNGPRNPLWKVQPVIDAMKNGCHKITRSPGRYSVDEQMIPFTGKCEMRQLVKGKPRPVGLKAFVVTTSDGLMMDFEIYFTNNPAFADRSLGLGPAVVLYLAQSVPPGSCIFFDRYFTTIPLLERLKELNLHGTGTIMTNRVADRHQANFKEDKQFKRGDIDQRVLDDKIALVKWRDSRCIMMASNCTGGTSIEIVKRYDKNRKIYVDVDAPKIVTDYNRYMGGVDVLDQSMEYYRSFIKTRKWTLKVILHFLDLAVVNSWRLYRCHSLALGMPSNKIMDLLAFRLQIAESLLSTPDRARRDGTPPSPEIEQAVGIKRYRPTKEPSIGKRFDGYDHLPIADRLNSPRSCRNPGCSSRTKTRYRKCNVYLCITPGNDCFYLYHTPA